MEETMQSQVDSLVEALREAKSRSGKTNQQLSDETGIPLTTISRLFSGAVSSPGFFVVCPVCAALGLSADALAGLPTHADSPDLEALQAEVAHKEELIAEKDKAIARLEERSHMMEHEITAVRDNWKGVTYGASGLAILFGLFLMVYVFLDMRNPNLGLFRGATAAPIVYIAAFSIVGTCLFIGHTMVKRRMERKRKAAEHKNSKGDSL